jgi:hypothetical protein
MRRRSHKERSTLPRLSSSEWLIRPSRTGQMSRFEAPTGRLKSGAVDTVANSNLGNGILQTDPWRGKQDRVRHQEVRTNRRFRNAPQCIELFESYSNAGSYLEDADLIEAARQAREANEVEAEAFREGRPTRGSRCWSACGCASTGERAGHYTHGWDRRQERRRRKSDKYLHHTVAESPATRSIRAKLFAIFSILNALRPRKSDRNRSVRKRAEVFT